MLSLLSVDALTYYIIWIFPNQYIPEKGQEGAILNQLQQKASQVSRTDLSYGLTEHPYTLSPMMKENTVVMGVFSTHNWRDCCNKSVI
jgi:hypothetical protein